MIASASLRQVSRNVAIGGGAAAAISAIASSPIVPGPLGIAETSPSASAPQRIASCASATLLMQQILTRGMVRMRSLRLRHLRRARSRSLWWQLETAVIPAKAGIHFDLDSRKPNQDGFPLSRE